MHCGLDSALESHPCVALSSYQALPVYSGLAKRPRENTYTLVETALNPRGLGDIVPHHSDAFFRLRASGNKSAGVR